MAGGRRPAQRSLVARVRCLPLLRCQAPLARRALRLTPSHPHQDLGPPLPHLHRDWAHPCYICPATGPAPATSASALPHLEAHAPAQFVASRCVAGLQRSAAQRGWHALGLCADWSSRSTAARTTRAAALRARRTPPAAPRSSEAAHGWRSTVQRGATHYSVAQHITACRNTAWRRKAAR